MRTEDMYYNEQKRSEVMEVARRLRRKNGLSVGENSAENQEMIS